MMQIACKAVSITALVGMLSKEEFGFARSLPCWEILQVVKGRRCRCGDVVVHEFGKG